MFPSLSRYLFRFIHSNFLVYNTSWEDAEVDRELLNLNAGSNIFMITGAGCNVLTYLLDKPEHITAIDFNYRQNALLDLKLTLLRNSNYENLCELFVKGKSENYLGIYGEIRPFLETRSQHFWDRHIHYFKPGGKGFYYSGTSGFFARMLNFVIDQKGLRQAVQQLLSSNNKKDRARIFYGRIEPKLWSGLPGKLWKSNAALSLVGVPASQAAAVPDLKSFMQKTLPELFVHQNPARNFYWRVYLEGTYPEEFLPPWLKEEHFETLREKLDSIHIKTSGVNDFLSRAEQTYSHFVLLDHMDWKAKNERKELEKEWRLILRHSQPGSKILFRTAYPNLDFLPAFVFDYVDFTSKKDMSLVNRDRVGTYTGTYLGVVEH